MDHFKLKHLLTIIMTILYLATKASTKQLISNVLPCLQFKNRLCIRCPESTHIKDKQCYQNIENCTLYLYGTASAICKKFIDQQIETLSKTSTITIKNSSYFFSSTTTLESSPSLNRQVLKQISFAQAQKDSLFLKCNNFMRRGQYSHFISRSQNPVKSVFQSFSQGSKDFKILYEGSGGNLLMCLIGINIETSVILLRSFVTIGRAHIIQDCVDYTSAMQCNRCKEGHHLDQTQYGDKSCYQDIPGCIEYYGNICTKCRGHYLLVENRCMSGCEELRDSRSIRFYGGYDLSKAQSFLMEISRSYF